MLRVVISSLIIFHSGYSIAQREYYKYRATLPGVTNKDSMQYEHALNNIPLLERWIKNHEFHYRAYYDLAIEYYTLSFYDTAHKVTLNEKAVKLNNRYLALAPQKQKYQGYWNNAIVYSRLGKCREAIASLNIAKEHTPNPRKRWDYESEEGIRKKCDNPIVAPAKK